MKALAAAMRKLGAGPQGRLPQSALTRSQQRALGDFIRHNGCVKTEPAGRGIVYRITDRGAFDNHLRELAPMTSEEVALLTPARAANIGLTRHSKSGRHGHEHYYLLLKAGPQTGVSWHRGAERGNDEEIAGNSEKAGDRHGGNTHLDLSRATRDYGAATLAIQPADDWHSDTPLWLIENQALFDRTDWLPQQAPAAVALYRGQLPGLLLDWLARRPRSPQVIHFPDYDGVGLMNYARLCQRLGGQCRFWLMPDWKNKLARFGNNRLWRETSREFHSAVNRLAQRPDPELQDLITAMGLQGLALEQEAVWL